jgi:tyrosyl-tRNA synthetase
VRYRLARLIVTEFHGAGAARSAEDAVRARHAARQSGQFDEVASLQTVRVTRGPDGSVSTSEIVTLFGFAPSKSEATRQIRSGGVRINGEVTRDMRWVPTGAGPHLLTVGAKKAGRFDVVDRVGEG